MSLRRTPGHVNYGPIRPGSDWTTGDIKWTMKTSADSGWVMMDDGEIGNASSGASTRANADCLALFTLLWNNVSSPTANAYCAVSGGLGASAAADWAADKTLDLPKALGRVFGVSGSGSGLTARDLGEDLGAETHTHTGTTDNNSSTFNIDDTGESTSIANPTHAHTFTTGNGSSMQPSLFSNAMMKL